MVAAPSCLDIEPHPDLIIILPFESTTQTVNSRLYHEGIHSEREQAPPEIALRGGGDVEHRSTLAERLCPRHRRLEVDREQATLVDDPRRDGRRDEEPNARGSEGRQGREIAYVVSRPVCTATMRASVWGPNRTAK